MIQQSYEILAASTNGLASIGQIAGPPGMVGEITSVSAVCTTAITGSGELSIGNAADEASYGTFDIPATSQFQRVAGTHRPTYSNGGRTDISPDDVIDLAITNATTLGAANFFITIDWR